MPNYVKRTSDVLSQILTFSGWMVGFGPSYAHVFMYSIRAFLGLFLESKSMQIRPSCQSTIEVLMNIVNVKQIISDFRGFKCIIHTHTQKLIRKTNTYWNCEFTVSVFGVFHFHSSVKELLIAWLHYTTFHVLNWLKVLNFKTWIGLANIFFQWQVYCFYMSIEFSVLCTCWLM